MLTKTLAALTLAGCCVFSAQAAAPGKQECLACHGSFDALIAKGITVEADPKPVNPHKYIPHVEKGGMNEIWECTMCHTPHAMPPKKDPNREKANVEACYQCHHQYNFQKCDDCHGGSGKQ